MPTVTPTEPEEFLRLSEAIEAVQKWVTTLHCRYYRGYPGERCDLQQAAVVGLLEWVRTQPDRECLPWSGVKAAAARAVRQEYKRELEHKRREPLLSEKNLERESGFGEYTVADSGTITKEPVDRGPLEPDPERLEMVNYFRKKLCDRWGVWKAELFFAGYDGDPDTLDALVAERKRLKKLKDEEYREWPRTREEARALLKKWTDALASHPHRFTGLSELLGDCEPKRTVT